MSLIRTVVLIYLAQYQAFCQLRLELKCVFRHNFDSIHQPFGREAISVRVEVEALPT